MPLFDDTIPFEVHILSGGEKVANLRFPNNQQLCDRSKRIKSTRKLLGRNKTEYEPANMELVDSELFEKLRLDPGGDAVDPADASKFLTRLFRCEVTDVERSGDVFSVEMKVVGGIKVVHKLRMPTQKDILDYGRNAVRLIDMRRTQQFTMNLEPAGALWDRLVVGTEGYANGSVPIIHKDTAIMEVVSQMESAEDADEGEA